MATTKLKKPKMLSKRKFDGVMTVEDFNNLHGTQIEEWEEVLDTHFYDDKSYGLYEKWYMKNFTKLGRALS